MKQYKMPFILGCVAWILAGLSLIIGIIDLVQKGLNKNTYFAAIICIGAALSGVNLLRLHRQLKNRKPPVNNPTKEEEGNSKADSDENLTN
jgi:hypothetical protein